MSVAWSIFNMTNNKKWQLILAHQKEGWMKTYVSRDGIFEKNWLYSVDLQKKCIANIEK
jgi:hypothetical protein